jgi:phosphopantothenoylcysteine decarboxylase/phosphopantothenate--cysteine ligase
VSVAEHKPSLHGKQVLVTAGPTRENIDPVRFLSNRSSGKMGYAVAAEAAARGARVVLVSGPTHLQKPLGAQCIDVTTTSEMLEAVLLHAAKSDIIIAAAAPADFAPLAASEKKIKKNGANSLQLELAPTPDVLAAAAKGKTSSQIFVGFAAETGASLDEARRKLATKNLDAIVFNDVTGADAGFDVETNRVTWITADSTDEWPLMTKREVAAMILDRIASQ